MVEDKKEPKYTPHSNEEELEYSPQSDEDEPEYFPSLMKNTICHQMTICMMILMVNISLLIVASCQYYLSNMIWHQMSLKQTMISYQMKLLKINHYDTML